VSDPRRIVAAGYDALGHRYRDWSSGSPHRIAQIERILARLEPGSTVVDLGCGPGEPATRLLSAAHRVLGVDVSAGQLMIAAAAAPGALLVRADMTELALRPGSVDAVVSFYALGHLPPDAFAPLFAAVACWLRPGGLLLTSAPRKPGAVVEEEWLGVPMFFGGIGDGPTLDAVTAAGLVVESTEVLAEDERGGGIVEFLWITATKPL
jgi:SAM-dependent methyltransferase